MSYYISYKEALGLCFGALEVDCGGLAEGESYQIRIKQTGWGHIDSSGYRNRWKRR